MDKTLAVDILELVLALTDKMPVAFGDILVKVALHYHPFYKRNFKMAEAYHKRVNMQEFYRLFFYNLPIFKFIVIHIRHIMNYH
jgi:hypothetical protein